MTRPDIPHLGTLRIKKKKSLTKQPWSLNTTKIPLIWRQFPESGYTDNLIPPVNPSIAVTMGRSACHQLGDYPSPLKDLFTGSNTAESSNFQDNIRQYNSTFSFAPFKFICPLGLHYNYYTMCHLLVYIIIELNNKKLLFFKEAIKASGIKKLTFYRWGGWESELMSKCHLYNSYARARARARARAVNLLELCFVVNCIPEA